jgi:hypothetical protein
MRFIKELSEFMKPIMYRVNFNTKTVNWACTKCESDYKKKNCVSDGKFCAINKDSINIKGRDIIDEDLRQMCIV